VERQVNCQSCGQTLGYLHFAAHCKQSLDEDTALKTNIKCKTKFARCSQQQKNMLFTQNKAKENLLGAEAVSFTQTA